MKNEEELSLKKMEEMQKLFTKIIEEYKYKDESELKLDLFIKKLEMINYVDSFFMDIVLELERNLRDDEKFSKYFFESLEFFLSEYLDNISLVLKYFTMKCSVKKIYLHFLTEYEKYLPYQKDVLDILESIVDNDDLIKQYHFIIFLKQATLGKVHTFTEGMTEEEINDKLDKLWESKDGK